MLQMELYEAKLTKAKLERAEMSTDFTKERLELHKSLVEAKENIDILLKREENMLEQIDLYKQQAAELQAAMVRLPLPLNLFATVVIVRYGERSMKLELTEA